MSELIINRIKDMIHETEGDIEHLIDKEGVAGIANRGGIRHRAISYCKLHIKDLLELQDIIEKQLKNKTPVYYSLEKYEHELSTLDDLFKLLHDKPSMDNVMLWIHDRMDSIQKKIDECQYILEKMDGEDAP